MVRASELGREDRARGFQPVKAERPVRDDAERWLESYRYYREIGDGKEQAAAGATWASLLAWD